PPAVHTHPHPFPTRRSSDLQTARYIMSSHATGPRSDAGKARSALNATTHGLRSERPVVPGEDAAEWDAFHADIVACYAPANTLEDRKSTRLNSSHQIISYAV